VVGSMLRAARCKSKPQTDRELASALYFRMHMSAGLSLAQLRLRSP